MTAADSRDRFYTDQHGNPMTLAGHLEALTGQRLHRDSLFESGQPRREVTMPQRELVVGDPDDPEEASYGFADGTRQVAAWAAAQMGIAPASASRGPDRFRAQRDAAASRPALARPARLPRPGLGESTRERAERRKSGMVQVNDPVMGELPVYMAG